MMKQVWLAMIMAIMMVSMAYGASDFEDLTVPAEGYYNGSDGAGGFTSGDTTFANAYNAEFSSWEGFAYSAATDTTTPGFGNQFSAITGEGATGSTTYAVAFTGGFNIPSSAEFATTTTISGAYITNTTYAYLSMLEGDDFSKKFGGATGDDPDYLKLIVKGYDDTDTQTGEVEFYLADFRYADNSLDYIIDEWTWVDLTRLGAVVRLEFKMESTDVGDFGMNTPAYFALDNLDSPPPTTDLFTFEDLTVPAEGYYDGSDSAGGFTSGDTTFANAYNAEFSSWEGFAYSAATDTTTPGFGNQFSAITGEGATGSTTYAVAFTGGFNIPSSAEFATTTIISGAYITNTTYAYLSMLEGDDFSKKFGGATGDDPDYLKLIVKGYDDTDTQTGEVEFYLADFRYADNSLDYIVDEWTWVDLTRLGAVVRLEFKMESTDVGDFGMNTPAYFALDGSETPIVNPSGDNSGGGSSSGCFITVTGSQSTNGSLGPMAAMLITGLGVLGIIRK